MNNKVKYTLLLPAKIWKILDSHLSMNIQKIGNTKAKNTYKNCWWNMVALFLKEYWKQDNKYYFKNIRQAKIQNILGQKDSYIHSLKTDLLNTGVFQTNQSYSANKGFSFGYRLNPDFVSEYTALKKTIKKRFKGKTEAGLDVNQLPCLNNKVQVDFWVKDKLNLAQITNKFSDFSNSKLNLNKGIKERERELGYFDYIKCQEDSSFIDQKYSGSKKETEKNIYGDDKIMVNEWQKKLMQRTEQITVDLRELWNTCEDSYFLEEWVMRIHHADVTGDKKAIFKHGRIYYNPYWSNLPSHLRHACRWNGQKVWQIFDVKNCFATLSLKLLEGKVSDEEYQKYKMIVKNGIYEAIAASTGEYDRDDVKQPFCHWLFANSSVKTRALDPVYILVRDYFRTEFPQIYNYLLSYPEIEIVNEFGVKERKSRLSVDCQWVENKLVMNTLAPWVEQTFGVQVLTLHDAIWVKGDEWLKVDKKAIVKKWYEIMGF